MGLEAGVPQADAYDVFWGEEALPQKRHHLRLGTAAIVSTPTKPQQESEPISST